MPAGTDPLRPGLIGEHDPSVTAHRAIPLALARAAAATGLAVEVQWLDTAALARDPSMATTVDGLWAVPATPYADGEAATHPLIVAFVRACAGARARRAAATR